MNKPIHALSIVCLLVPFHASAFAAVVIDGAVVEFNGPDGLLLDPSSVAIAVDVFGDQDRVVNGVTFRTDGQVNGVGTATEGLVTVTTTAANQINNWTNAPNFTGADPVSAANLSEIMRDIRWNGAPNPVEVAISGLTPGSTYNLQLLFNEGGDRNRVFDIAVEGQLVVDNMTSEGEGVWSPDNSFAYTGNFTLPANDSVLNAVLQQDLGGDPNPGGDNNPILQAVIVHGATTASPSIPEPSSGLILTMLGMLGGGSYLVRKRFWSTCSA